jgi:hypothetical protein
MKLYIVYILYITPNNSIIRCIYYQNGRIFCFSIDLFKKNHYLCVYNSIHTIVYQNKFEFLKDIFINSN